MTAEIVTAEEVPLPSRPFAPPTLATGARILSVSGQIAQSKDGELVGADDAGEQARHAFATSTRSCALRERRRLTSSGLWST